MNNPITENRDKDRKVAVANGQVLACKEVVRQLAPDTPDIEHHLNCLIMAVRDHERISNT